MTKKHFERGGKGVFTCTSCGRKTRETTSDNDEVCGPCYELAGLENGVADGHPMVDYLDEAKALYAQITSKGGTYGFWTELGDAVKAA
jgi:hypothetical protein